MMNILARGLSLKHTYKLQAIHICAPIIENKTRSMVLIQLLPRQHCNILTLEVQDIKVQMLSVLIADRCIAESCSCSRRN